MGDYNKGMTRRRKKGNFKKGITISAITIRGMTQSTVCCRAVNTSNRPWLGYFSALFLTVAEIEKLGFSGRPLLPGSFIKC